jgi:tRNA dimethylallyltransferase
VTLVAVVGPTATGKSALALSLAEALDGEIVSCDSTAVYRGIDIGTDKLPAAERRGIPHHLIDVAGPDEVYSAARYAADAAAAIHAISARGRQPILAGGTGFYYRALVRGMFPGPARDEALRARLDRVADRRGVEALHRWLTRVGSGIGRCAFSRAIANAWFRALEVYLLTSRPLTDHFADTVSPLAGVPVVGDRPQARSRNASRARDAPRGLAVRGRCRRRSADAARPGFAGRGARLERPRLSAGPGVPARRARRARDAES